jgi:hypothetical protein
MRYRTLDTNDDYVVGQPWLVNSPQAVAQAVKTRLRLWQGEFFVDTTDGTPYLQQILGKRDATRNPDAAIKVRILGTLGVTGIAQYASVYDGNTRILTVYALVNTIYSTQPVAVAVPL